MKEVGQFKLVTNMDEVPAGADVVLVCRSHIDRIRAAIVREGLLPFLSANPEEAMDKMADPDPNVPWDPLMAVILTVTRVAVQNGMTGGGCPFCKAVDGKLTMVDDPCPPPKTVAEFEYYWLDAPVGAVAETFKENGWRLQ